jgi:hypothetical protein
MPNVVFVAPFAMESTLRFVRAAVSLPGVRLAVVSQDAPDKLSRDLLQQLSGFQQLADAMSPDPLAEAVRALGRQLGSVDALLSVLEPLQVPLAEVRERLGIAGMDRKTAVNFRDKARMKELLAAHDLPCARHRLCTNDGDALAFARAVGFPLVGKPPAGAGAKTTARLASETELQAFLAQTQPAPGRELLLEEFVQGREFSFDSFTLQGRHLFHSISDYHPTPLHVMENPWIQWTVVLPQDISGPEYAAIHRAGPAALTALGMWTGMSHLEWFRRQDGSIAIGEVAARPPGAQFMSLMGYAHDTDFYRAYAQLMVFGSWTPCERLFAAGAAYLRGQGDGVVARITGIEALRPELKQLIVEARLPQPGQAAASSYEGEGYVIVRHRQTAVVEQALAAIVRTLRVELAP